MTASPVDWWITPFAENPFLTDALLAGLLVAWSAAIAGTFVVLRGLAFLGDALSHGVLPGVAAALLIGAPGLAGAAVGAAVMIAGVNLVTSRSKLSGDTAIGLLYVGMLALGVVMVSRSPTFRGDIVGILFGDVFGASPTDIVRQLIAFAAVATIAAVFARPFLLLCFDPEQADVAGWSSRRYQAILLVMVTLTVVMSFQTVGTLLVVGMLLAPAGTGALLARRLPGMIGWAAAVGSVSVYLGLLLSYHYDVAGSACVVLVAVAIFFVAFTARAFGERRPPASSAVSPAVTPAPPAARTTPAVTPAGSATSSPAESGA